MPAQVQAHFAIFMVEVRLGPKRETPESLWSESYLTDSPGFRCAGDPLEITKKIVGLECMRKRQTKSTFRKPALCIGSKCLIIAPDGILNKRDNGQDRLLELKSPTTGASTGRAGHAA